VTKVKICGIQQPADAVAAAEAGADFIGMVFVPQRHRRLDREAAINVVRSLGASSASSPAPTVPKPVPKPVPKIVGLFAGQPLDEVNQLIDACGLDMAQLCGQESLEYCREVNAPVIKVIHVAASAAGPEAVGALAGQIAAYCDAGHLVTLDRLVEGIQGGTGHSFDWDIAAQLGQRGLSFLLAGGLSPDNVARAVAEVQPWGVDVSSGVETCGVKDRNKIQAFIHNAKTAQRKDC